MYRLIARVEAKNIWATGLPASLPYLNRSAEGKAILLVSVGIGDRFAASNKVADLALYDGDPFEHATHVTHMLIDGRVIYDRAEAQKVPLARRLLPLVDGDVGCCLGW